MAKNISDGNYTIEAILGGGSGKASISSPAKLNVTDGRMQAEIEWSSSNYDYMKIEDAEYYPINDEGNSVFLIDVPKLDSEINILAQTVAMSEPHMIEYTMYFDSSTIKADSNFSGILIGGVGAVIILALVTAVFLKRRKSDAK